MLAYLLTRLHYRALFSIPERAIVHDQIPSQTSSVMQQCYFILNNVFPAIKQRLSSVLRHIVFIIKHKFVEKSSEMLGPSSTAPVNVTNVSAQDKLMPVTETNKVSPDASFKTRLQIAFSRSFQLTREIVKSKNEFTEERHGFTCLDTYGKLSKEVSFNGYEIFALFYLIILVIMPSNIHGRPLGHSCPLLSPNSDNFSTLASSIRPPDVAYPPFMIYPTGSLLPLPPLLSPFYPSKSLNHPNKLYYVKTIGFILLGLAVPILLTVMRVIWNNAKLTRNFTRVVTDAVQNAQMGNISINDAVSRIQRYPRVERAVSHIILELVRNSTENGGIAGNILANLARSNEGDIFGLDGELRLLNFRKFPSEKFAYNTGCFFGLLYKEHCLDVAVFRHLRLSHQICHESPLVLPFLEGLFKCMEQFFEPVTSDVLHYMRGLFVGRSSDDYVAWFSLLESLLDYELPIILQLYQLMRFASGRDAEDPEKLVI